jgi:hypothetical protein
VKNTASFECKIAMIFALSLFNLNQCFKMRFLINCLDFYTSFCNLKNTCNKFITCVKMRVKINAKTKVKVDTFYNILIENIGNKFIIDI